MDKFEERIDKLEQNQGVIEERLNTHISLTGRAIANARDSMDKATKKIDSLDAKVNTIKECTARSEGYSKGAKSTVVITGVIIGILQGLIALAVFLRG